MKTFYLPLVIIVLALNDITMAQSNYNQELEKAAKTISQKITSSGKKSVAVLDFENSNKQNSELGSWLASVFTTHLENNSENAFAVKNRSDIEKAIQQIKSESGSGAYDSKTIQRLGEISGSDVIVYGEITLMDDEITVNIRTKNISLNETIGGVLVNFSATEGMRTKYDNYIDDKPTGAASNTNSPASGEGSDKKSKDLNCKENITGDFCFLNTTNYQLTASVTGNQIFPISLDPNQTQCYFSLPQGSYSYEIYETRLGRGPYWVPPGTKQPFTLSGQIYVEKCKSKTFIIR